MRQHLLWGWPTRADDDGGRREARTLVWSIWSGRARFIENERLRYSMEWILRSIRVIQAATPPPPPPAFRAPPNSLGPLTASSPYL